MKIALFHNLISGGAKRSVFEMVRRLVRDHQVEVFTLSSANHDFCDLRPLVDGYHIFEFEPLLPFKSPFGALNYGLRLVDIVRLRLVQRDVALAIDRHRFDVVLVHPDQFTTTPLLLQFLSTPSVYYCQDPLRQIYDPPIFRPYQQLSGIRRWINQVNLLRFMYSTKLAEADRDSIQAADLVLVNSYFSRETIYRVYGVAALVCYLGVDASSFEPANFQQKEDYVISVGSVNPIKGFDFTIDSLALVPKEIRPKLIIVGNFTVQEEQIFLQNKATAADVEIEFRILVSLSELVKLYQHARMTIYAPILEPFGLVPLESMACGTLVVGVAEGGVRETVRHGETGLLVDRDPRQFATAITELLMNRVYASELSERGPSYVQKNWSWDDCNKRIQARLQEIVTS